MAQKTKRFCKHAGCNVLLSDSAYCVAHAPLHDAEQQRTKAQHDKLRKNAHDRGYNYRWSKYSKAYLKRPGNQFCVLHLDNRCAIVSQCVDHIKPHKGQSDPLFWDSTNHQPACIHCNSVKGDRVQIGTYLYGAEPDSGKRRE